MTAGSHSGWAIPKKRAASQNALHENAPTGIDSKFSVVVRYRSRNERQNSSSMTGTSRQSPYRRTTTNAAAAPGLSKDANGLNPTRVPRCGYGIHLSMPTHAAKTAPPTITAGMTTRRDGRMSERTLRHIARLSVTAHTLIRYRNGYHDCGSWPSIAVNTPNTTIGIV